MTAIRLAPVFVTEDATVSFLVAVAAAVHHSVSVYTDVALVGSQASFDFESPEGRLFVFEFDSSG